MTRHRDGALQWFKAPVPARGEGRRQGSGTPWQFTVKQADREPELQFDRAFARRGADRRDRLPAADNVSTRPEAEARLALKLRVNKRASSPSMAP